MQYTDQFQPPALDRAFSKQDDGHRSMSAIKSICLGLILWLSLSMSAFAVGCAGTGNCYWEGGSSNWSDTTKWCTTDTNPCTGATGAVPTSADNCNFTATSNATAYTVTVDALSFCNNMTWALPGTSGVPTWAGSGQLRVAGSITAVATMVNTYTGTLNLIATGSVNITSAGTQLTGDNINFGFQNSGTYTLQDALTVGAAHQITVQGGTLNANAKTVTTGSFVSTSGTRTLTLDNSTINLTGTSGSPLNISSAGALTFSATGSTFNVNGGTVGASISLATGAGSGVAYNNFNITAVGTVNFQSTAAGVIKNFSYTSSTNKTDTLSINPGFTIGASGSLTIAGNSTVNRAFVNSNSLGTQRTITVPNTATVSISNTDFQDIASAGTYTIPWTGATLTTSPKDFGDASWDKLDTTITTNTTTAPDGSVTADTVTEGTAGNALTSQGVVTASGAFMRARFAAKRGNTDWVKVSIGGGGSNTLRGWFNLNTGAAGSLTAGGVAVAGTISATALANGFYQLEITGSMPGVSSATLGFSSASADASLTRVNNATYILWNGELITTTLGDALGNSGITFDASVTLTLASTGTINWSSATWTSSGAARTAPLPQDDVSLGSSSTATTLTIDMPRMGRNIDASGYSKTLSHTIAVTMFGNLTLSSSMTFSSGASFTFGGRGSQTIASATKTFGSAVTVAAPAGTYTLQDNFAFTAGNAQTFTSTTGSVNCNGFNFTASKLSLAGSGTFTLSGTGTLSLTATSGTGITYGGSATSSIASTATVKLTGAITALTLANAALPGGAGNLWWSSTTATGVLTITGANTFNDFKINRTTARGLRFPAATTTNISSWTDESLGTAVLTIDSSSAGSQATLRKTSGIVSTDYLSLKDNAATGGAAFFAGNHSSIVSNVTGWILAGPGGGGLLTLGVGGWLMERDLNPANDNNPVGLDRAA